MGKVVIDIDDYGELYYKNKNNEWVKLEYEPPTEDDIKQQKVEAKKKLRKLTLFKLELMHLYDKYGITIEYDYDSVSFEFKDSYSQDYIIYRIDSEIDNLKRIIGE